MATEVPGDSAGVVGETKASGARTWPAALAAGLIAAVVSGAIGEVTANWFVPGGNLNVSPMEGGGIDLSDLRAAAVKNAALTDGLQGVVLGLALGLAGGLVGRSGRRALMGGLVGAVAGGMAGALAALGVFSTYLRTIDPNSDDLVPPLLAHAAVWGLIGAGGGLGFGVGRGSGIGRAMIGGFLGAAVGAGVYEVAGATLFATEKTSQPLAAATVPRLIGHATTALLASTGAALALGTPTTRRKPQA